VPDSQAAKATQNKAVDGWSTIFGSKRWSLVGELRYAVGDAISEKDFVPVFQRKDDKWNEVYSGAGMK